jgi:aminopeptidase-like protein
MNTRSSGQDMYDLMQELFPICRSITGNGVRETLEIIKKIIPIEIHEIPSNTQVYDWKIPKEWNIRDAYVKDSSGKKIIDFQKSNLHVLNYSIPINTMMPLSKLKDHLFTLPYFPDEIPYLTSYYKENWGFCLSHNQFSKLDEGMYEIFIDSTLEDGSLTYGELLLSGKSEDEVLLSTYICHPSMCNDNLSGTSLLTFLAKKMLENNLQYSYRFLFIPETIGAISWLSKNEKKLSKIKQGLVATCLGDKGNLTYKKSKFGNALIDKIAIEVLTKSSSLFNVIDFFPYGSDERQFSSPGINLDIGSLMRTPYGKFNEYHTSADNLKFMDLNCLNDSFKKYYQIIMLLEKQNSLSNEPENLNSKILINEIQVSETDDSKKYLSLNPKCEPQLGKHGLYRMIGGQKDFDLDEMSIFWILCFSDGDHSLKYISERSGINLDDLEKTANLLCEKNLLKSIF